MLQSSQRCFRSAGMPTPIKHRLPRCTGGPYMGKFERTVEELNKIVEYKKTEYKYLTKKIKKERDKYKMEVEKMNFKMVDAKDVLVLNVSGSIMTTTRRTLTQVEGSMLEAMFSGRWEKCLTKDEEGRVFLDYDPGHFASILQHLRALMMNEEKEREMWRCELAASPGLAMLWAYLGKEEEPVDSHDPFRFTSGSQYMTINKAGVEAIRNNNSERDYYPVVCDNQPMVKGRIYYWKLQIVAAPGTWPIGCRNVALGIDTWSTPPGGGRTRRWDKYCPPFDSSTCWEGGGIQYPADTSWAGNSYESGSLTPLNSFTPGDLAIFQCDLIKGTLSMWLPRLNQKFVIHINTSDQWYVCAFAAYNGSTITLLEVTEADKQHFR